MEIKRLHVGKRLSEVAIHNNTVYLAGQIPDDLSLDIKARRAKCWAISTACWPKPAATRPAS
jgi:enamine deaminase RidA (YjgF/YER057c/UK114 family)